MIRFLIMFAILLLFSLAIYSSNRIKTLEKIVNDLEIEVKFIESKTSLLFYANCADEYIKKNKISTSLVLAIIKAESNFDSNAVSRKGALGLMQLMPETALEEHKKIGGDISMHELKKSLIDQPELNVILGISYFLYLENHLSEIEDKEKRLKLVLASYNAGLHTVKRAFECKGFKCYFYKINRYSNKYFNESLKRLPKETQIYIQSVIDYEKLYKQAFGI